MRGTFIFIPLDVATTPAEGHAYVNRWWAVHPARGVVFYVYGLSDDPAPQCNASEDVARRVVAKILPACEVRHLPVVFAAHARRLVRSPAQQLGIGDEPGTPLETDDV